MTIEEFVVSDLSPVLEAWPIKSIANKCLRIPMQIPENGNFFLCAPCLLMNKSFC